MRIAQHEHAVQIVIPVTRDLVQLALGHVRGLGEQVAALLLHVLNPALKQLYDARALGQYYGQALADNVDRGEVLQLAAELIVVALLGFLNLRNILVQLVLGRERRAVDALEHLILFVAAPVRARNLSKLYRLHLAGRGQMRASAQVGEVALLIERNRRVLGQVADKLGLIRLALFLAEGDCLGAGQFKALKAYVLLDDVVHFLFELGEHFGREVFVHVEVIIETVVDSRADSQLCIRDYMLHGLSQHMRRGMAQYLLAVVIGEGEYFHLNGRVGILINRLRKSLYLAVHARGQRGLLQVAVQLGKHIQRVRTVFKFVLLTIQNNYHNSYPPLPYRARKAVPRRVFREIKKAPRL